MIVMIRLLQRGEAGTDNIYSVWPSRSLDGKRLFAFVMARLAWLGGSRSGASFKSLKIKFCGLERNANIVSQSSPAEPRPGSRSCPGLEPGGLRSCRPAGRPGSSRWASRPGRTALSPRWSTGPPGPGDRPPGGCPGTSVSLPGRTPGTHRAQCQYQLSQYLSGPLSLLELIGWNHIIVLLRQYSYAIKTPKAIQDLGLRVDHSSSSVVMSHLFGFLLTDLSWNLIAGLARNLLTLLLGFLSRDVSALLSGNLIANFSGDLPALLSLHLVAHFLRNFTARQGQTLNQWEVKILNISYSQTSLATWSHSCLVTGSHWVL